MSIVFRVNRVNGGRCRARPAPANATVDAWKRTGTERCSDQVNRAMFRLGRVSTEAVKRGRDAAGGLDACGRMPRSGVPRPVGTAIVATGRPLGCTHTRQVTPYGPGVRTLRSRRVCFLSGTLGSIRESGALGAVGAGARRRAGEAFGGAIGLSAHQRLSSIGDLPSESRAVGSAPASSSTSITSVEGWNRA